MQAPVLAAGLTALGLVVAVIGFMVSVTASRRRRLRTPGAVPRADPFYVLMIAGLVAMVFGAGGWVLLLLTV